MRPDTRNSKTIVFAQAVADYVADRLGHPFVGERLGLGLMEGQTLIAGVAYTNRRDHEIHGHIFADPGSLTRGFIRAMFHYPFYQLGVRRITACARVSNHQSRKFLHRVGFALEGMQRSGYQDGEDKMLFGMLREECRWLTS